eukprot:GFYU01013605.1.p1 GENE.GFYU01013605.1~~GFYU01013605.1.p1  ORF type:complete len:114 (-),score=6.23 GFYU01013605.1:114-455(-)
MLNERYASVEDSEPVPSDAARNRRLGALAFTVAAIVGVCVTVTVMPYGSLQAGRCHLRRASAVRVTVSATLYATFTTPPMAPTGDSDTGGRVYIRTAVSGLASRAMNKAISPG